MPCSWAPGDSPLDSLDGLSDRVVGNPLAVVAIHADRVQLREPVDLLDTHAEAGVKFLRRGPRERCAPARREPQRCQIRRLSEGELHRGVVERGNRAEERDAVLRDLLEDVERERVLRRLQEQRPARHQRGQREGFRSVGVAERHGAERAICRAQPEQPHVVLRPVAERLVSDEHAFRETCSARRELQAADGRVDRGWREPGARTSVTAPAASTRTMLSK